MKSFEALGAILIHKQIADSPATTAREAARPSPATGPPFSAKPLCHLLESRLLADMMKWLTAGSFPVEDRGTECDDSCETACGISQTKSPRAIAEGKHQPAMEPQPGQREGLPTPFAHLSDPRSPPPTIASPPPRKTNKRCNIRAYTAKATSRQTTQTGAMGVRNQLPFADTRLHSHCGLIPSLLSPFHSSSMTAERDRFG